jgi:type VI secretion system protein ImpM
MFSWVGRAKDPAPSVLGFGKVPAAAEYVRCGPKTEAASDFEDWLVGAIEWAAGSRAQRWKAEHDNAPVQSFLYRTGVENQLIAGVARPSRDSVGRRFPLVIAVHMAARPFAGSVHLVPMLLSGFFQRATGLLMVASRAKSAAEFEDTVRKLDVPDFGRLEDLASQYHAWTRDTPAWEWLEGLFELTPVDAAEHALHVVMDAAAPFRGKEAPRTSLSVRLPLPRPAEPASCSFWLDIVRLASGWKQTVPGFFAAEGRSVLVQLGEPAHGSVLADVWMPDAGSDYVCDASAISAGNLITPMPERVRAAVQDPCSSLADILAAMEP